MKALSKLKVTGKLQVVINGKLAHEFDNLVVTAGKEWVAGMMSGAGVVMSHMEVGSSDLGANDSQTALVTPVLRKALTSAGGTQTANTVQYECTYADGEADGALTEAGLFDAASGGNMLSRTVFDVINKGAGDVMTIIWTITVA